MHVATTKRRYKGKTYKNYLIRTSYRQDGKVKHKTLANITHLPEDLIEVIRQRLKSGKPITAQGFSIIRSLPHGHVAAILQTIKDIGLDSVLSAKRVPERDVIIALITLRLLQPGSKLSCYRRLTERQATTTLAGELDLQQLSYRQLYQSLDWLVERQGRIEKKLADKHLDNSTLVLYDLTSSYYTGRQSELVRFGYNRDGKRGHPQVVFGLICNEQGCPVGVEVFSGNTDDSTTLAGQIRRVRQQFGIDQVVWVGDRGLITGKVIDTQLRPTEGAEWITALRASQIRKLADDGNLQLSLFDQQDLAELQSPDYPDERLVACRNPLLAEQRRHNRQQLLEATCRQLDQIVAATQRQRRPLKGKDEIGLRVGKVIDKYKMGKHVQLSITEDSFSYTLNQESIAAEQGLDGIYVLRTSLPASQMPADQTVENYKRLSQVEWAFRSMKTTRLQVRPIYHWLDGRIKAHIFLCMLAYYLEWHMRRRLTPLLYQDEDKQQAHAMRSSPVASATPSKTARKKAECHSNEHGQPVHSMQTLLEDLGTICKNEICIDTRQQTFEEITQPTADQQEILNLLGVEL